MAGRRAGTALAGAIAAIALAACSLFTTFDGLLPRAEGSDGGLPDGSVEDGAHGDGTSGDALADARGRDGTTSDAGHDAAPETGPISCDAGLVQCGAGCASLQSDPHNCNRCGHDCQGGACMAGVCEAVTLATMQHQPDQIIAIGSRLYWSNDSCCPFPIMECALPDCTSDGGVAPSVFLMNGNSVVAFTTDSSASTLYWLDQQKISGCPVGTSCPSPTNLANVQNGGNKSTQLATSATALYWNENRSIQSCPFTGCPAGASTLFQQNNGHVLGLTVGGGNAYWGRDCCPSEVRSCSASVCLASPMDLAVLNNGQVNYLATDGSSVFWTTSNGEVMSCPLAGCPPVGPTVVASGLPQPQYILAESRSCL